MVKYFCDNSECKSEINEKEVLNVRVCYERTREELDNFCKYRQDIPMEEIRIKTSVNKNLHLCKGCYDNFKKIYFS